MLVPVALIASCLGAAVLLGCSPEAADAPEVATVAATHVETAPRILILRAGTGPVHGETAEVVAAIGSLAQSAGLAVSEASLADELDLPNFRAVVFVHTAAESASLATRRELRRFVEAGGGGIFVHAPLAPSNDWGTARRWLGLRRAEHAEQRERRIFDASAGGAGVAIDSGWHRLSELSDDSEVVLRAGDEKPVAWKRRVAAGRIFVSDLGHDAASLSGELAQRHLGAAFEWAVAKGALDYTSVSLPVGSWQKRVLATNVEEPVALALLPGGDGSLLFTERRGAIKLYEAGATAAVRVGELVVDASGEGGLLGLALDPSFAETGWLYLLSTRAATGAAPRRHEISRFTYDAASKALDLASEKLLLAVPLEADGSDHVGGALAMSAGGELFIAIGDDTRIAGSAGYAPLDTAPGRAAYDAARSAGNTADLRGSVLRILPMPDGGITLPPDNLFGPASPYAGQGRLEIYAMGFRNPFTLALDSEDGALYVGGPGPDANRALAGRGPAGVDELNRIEVGGAGNFGWPFFGGNGLAYAPAEGKATTAAAPRNNSPNNTGSELLPPALPPLLDFGYSTSRSHPEFGRGPRSVWVGGVSDRPGNKPGRRLLLGDFMRKTLHWVELDSAGGVERIERVAPGTRWNDPINGRLAADGSVYVLEYGAGWYSGNADAQLSRLVRVEPGSSVVPASEPRSRNGEPLAVRIDASPSRSFFGSDPTQYEVSLSRSLPAHLVAVSLHSADSFSAVGASRASEGPDVWMENGCVGCHAASAQPSAAAPSRDEVRARYANANAATVSRLIEKVRLGGAGSFGTRPMPPHPGLDEGTRRALIETLLATERVREIEKGLPSSGAFEVAALETAQANGSTTPRGPVDARVLVLRAQANDVAAELVLRAKHFPASAFDASAGTQRVGTNTQSDGVMPKAEGAWLRYEDMDLRGVAEFSLWFAGAAEASGALVEVHLDSPEGPLVGERAVLQLADGALTEASFALGTGRDSARADGDPPRDLFIVFRRGRARSDYVLLSLDFD